MVFILSYGNEISRNVERCILVNVNMKILFCKPTYVQDGLNGKTLDAL